MEKILLPNAYNAWKAAISYHDQIENGFSSLDNQKWFVSSLHNAVELFLKQIMLDNNDNDVARMFSIKSEENAKLALKYYQAKDLNLFFSNLSYNDLNKFRSIDFSELIKKAARLLETEDDDKALLSGAMKLLQELRNNETHFYISHNYLSESNFILLHNFMILYYDLIAHKELFPCVIQNLKQIGMKDYIQMPKEFKFFKFDREPISCFSYKEALISNELTQEIKESLNGECSCIYSTLNIYDSFNLAEVMSVYEEKYAPRFYDTFIILALLNSYNLLELVKDSDGLDKIIVKF